MSTKDVYLNVLFAYCTQPIHISTTLVHWECVFRLGDVVGQVVWITLWTQSVINPERFDGVRSRLSVMDPLTEFPVLQRDCLERSTFLQDQERYHRFFCFTSSMLSPTRLLCLSQTTQHTTKQ